MPRCKHCKDKFTPRKFNWKYCHKSECMDIGVSELLSKQREKQAKDREEVDKATKEKKERQSLATLRNGVMTVCHTFIKLRDKGKPCVSCGQPYKPDHDAGHWKSAKDYSNLRYDERNIHGQCIGCNRFKRGNIEAYNDRIHLRIGTHGKEAIEKAATKYKHSGFKWEREKLVAIRTYYREKIKSLKKHS